MAYSITAQRGIIATVGYQSPLDWGRGMTAAAGAFSLTRRSAYLEAPGERRRFGIVT